MIPPPPREKIDIFQCTSNNTDAGMGNMDNVLFYPTFIVACCV